VADSYNYGKTSDNPLHRCQHDPSAVLAFSPSATAELSPRRHKSRSRQGGCTRARLSHAHAYAHAKNNLVSSPLRHQPLSDHSTHTVVTWPEASRSIVPRR